MKMLDHFCKRHRTLVVQKKAKVQKRKKKAKSERFFFINVVRSGRRDLYSYTEFHFVESERQTALSLEPSEERWSEVEPRITDIFANNTELDVQSIPFDAASDIPFEEQKLVFQLLHPSFIWLSRLEWLTSKHKICKRKTSL